MGFTVRETSATDSLLKRPLLEPIQMAGIFAQWQPVYAEANIVTFPVDGSAKKPAVSNYLRAGAAASLKWAKKFTDANAFGFACGRKSGLTILDIDTPDETVLADALARCGSTQVIARTHSGKFHAYYRYSGEQRKIRPDKAKPIDILGENGFAVAPPSVGTKGSYEFISGDLGDLASLPVMRPLLAIADERPTVWNDGSIKPGERNNSLWRACMGQARFCTSRSELGCYAAEMNRSALSDPLPDEEVKRIVASAWSKQEAGENWFGTGERLVLSFKEVDCLLQDDPDAFMLLTILRRNHDGLRDTFVVANAMHKAMPGGGWALRRFQAARASLLDRGILSLVQPPSAKRGPGIYRLS